MTAAHEFFHAIQFGYDVYEDLWFMEGTATWVEDEVYDSINDNYQFLAYSPIRYPRTSLDRADGAFPYGSFLFFTFVSEQRGAGTVRDFWERAAAGSTSLQAIHDVVGASAWPSFFSLFGSCNTLPAGSYSERAGYPAPAWWLRKTLSQRVRAAPGGRRCSRPPRQLRDAGSPPHGKLGRRARVLVTVDGPPVSAGDGRAACSAATPTVACSTAGWP